MKKIIFTDLDGTLLDDNRQVSPENRRTIDEALAQGHQIVITSGRPLASVKLIAKELGLTSEGCYAIASNGAILYDTYNDKILKQICLPNEYVVPMFERAREAGLHIHTYTDDNVICEEDRKEVHWYENEIRVPAIVVDDISKHVTYDPIKIILLDLDNKQNLIDFQTKHMPYTEGKMETLFSNDRILEYCPLGVSKGKAVKELCELLNIPLENSVSAGDAENDISLVEAAHIGCAMCNGYDSVKARANYVTQADNNHDGFAEIMKKFVLNQ